MRSNNILSNGGKYAWAENQPKETFSATNYRWYQGNESGAFITGDWDGTYTKYTTWIYLGMETMYTNSNSPSVSDDPAHHDLGGSWRTPTKSQMEELANDCDWAQISINGKWGWKVTGPNGAWIFLPCSAYNSLSIGAGSSEVEDYWWTSQKPASAVQRPDDYLFLAYTLAIATKYLHRGGIVTAIPRFRGAYIRPVYRVYNP